MIGKVYNDFNRKGNLKSDTVSMSAILRDVIRITLNRHIWRLICELIQVNHHSRAHFNLYLSEISICYLLQYVLSSVMHAELSKKLDEDPFDLVDINCWHKIPCWKFKKIPSMINSHRLLTIATEQKGKGICEKELDNLHLRHSPAFQKKSLNLL